jgi:hypothetical protein
MGTKAIAGTSSATLATALVAVGLWLAGLTPPQEIVLALQAIVSAPLTYIAVYFTPHNGA